MNAQMILKLPEVPEKTKEKIGKAEKVLLIAGKVLATMLLVCVFTGILCAGAFGLYVRKYLQPKADIDVGSINMNYSSVIYATNASTGEKTELTRLYGSENRVWANYDQIPKNLANAFIAIEDERFESHKGVDWKRTIGATINLILPFSSNFGGSTITQQVVKNLTGDNEPTIQRKVLELLRALNVERKL